MASKKRGAETQITKDDPEEAITEQDSGTWKQASETKLSQRKLVKVKRKKGASSDATTEPEESTEEVASEAEKKEEEEVPKQKIQFDFGVDSSASSGLTFDWGASANSDTTSDSTSTESWSSGGFSWGDGTGFGADPKGFNSFAGLASAAGTDSAFSFASSENTSSENTSTLLIEPTPQDSTSEFQNKKPEDSGTKDDVSLLRVLAKVYIMKEEKVANSDSSAVKEGTQQRFAEAGHGDLHVNTFTEDNKTRARLVLRMEKTQRLVLNAPIFKDMDYKIQGEKFLRFISFGLEGEPRLYLLKFKTKEDTNMVKKKIDECIKLLANGEEQAPQEQEGEQQEQEGEQQEQEGEQQEQEQESTDQQGTEGEAAAEGEEGGQENQEA